MFAIGTKAADFALPNQDGTEIALRDLGGKWVVVYFYPKDNTSGCTKEACDFSATLNEFEKAGAFVIGISPDSVKSHQNFTAKQNLTHTLLSDEEKTTLSAYGVWQQKSMYGRTYMGVARTTYLIAPDGTVAFVWERVKTTDHASAVLAKLRELKG
ncbi:peroxiredoxin [Campylobacterota bacterium]|nr:peroxiredoxin [Campylobacterota bacterium]